MSKQKPDKWAEMVMLMAAGGNAGLDALLTEAEVEDIRRYGSAVEAAQDKWQQEVYVALPEAPEWLEWFWLLGDKEAQEAAWPDVYEAGPC